ncbi:hypothetical protein R3P38DRAFT_3206498 [Favolaschia claudopus]|uniref:Uncharacterized protein n=1 Tax=Favolaschia claudopus TaxID=2862362 RepID=A0AAW0AN14_9AGAR
MSYHTSLRHSKSTFASLSLTENKQQAAAYRLSLSPPRATIYRPGVRQVVHDDAWRKTIVSLEPASPSYPISSSSRAPFPSFPLFLCYCCDLSPFGLPIDGPETVLRAWSLGSVAFSEGSRADSSRALRVLLRTGSPHAISGRSAPAPAPAHAATHGGGAGRRPALAVSSLSGYRHRLITRHAVFPAIPSKCRPPLPLGACSPRRRPFPQLYGAQYARRCCCLAPQLNSPARFTRPFASNHRPRRYAAAATAADIPCLSTTFSSQRAATTVFSAFPPPYQRRRRPPHDTSPPLVQREH